MGKGARLKNRRRQVRKELVRRELERLTQDPRHVEAVQRLVSELRTEAYYVIARLVDEALVALFGMGTPNRAKVWEYVKARAIWEPYVEQGLTINESVQEIERKKGERRNEQ